MNDGYDADKDAVKTGLEFLDTPENIAAKREAARQLAALQRQFGLDLDPERPQPKRRERDNERERDR